MKQPIDPIAFGRRVREKREELGLSQSALGKTSGFSQTNIGWIESGESKDPRKQVLKLTEPLRTSSDWLLYGTGDRNIAAPPFTAEEIAQSYDKFPLEDREAISEQVAAIVAKLNKKRKMRAGR